MMKFLLVGPTQDKRGFFLPGVRRTRQFSQALCSAGHEIVPVNPGERNAVRKHRPDAVLGIGVEGCFSAVQGAENLPLWLDTIAAPAGEVQLQDRFFHQKGRLFRKLEKWRVCLERGDFFSVASVLQKKVLVGELGGIGRLNRENIGTDLIRVLSPGLTSLASIPEEPFLKGKTIPEDRFLLAVNGPIGAWWDDETAGKALKIAFGTVPELVLAVPDEKAPETYAPVYRRFRAFLNRVVSRERFYFVRIRSGEEWDRFLHESDAALCVERDCIESETACRFRIVEAARAGLPMIGTMRDELSEELGRQGLFGPCFPGNAEAIAEKIIRFAQEHLTVPNSGEAIGISHSTPSYEGTSSDPPPYQGGVGGGSYQGGVGGGSAQGRVGGGSSARETSPDPSFVWREISSPPVAGREPLQAFFRKRLTIEETMRPFLEWAASPCRAPDAG